MLTLLCFVIVLCVTITIHEFGHFIFAKKAGIYVYEFSIGMGPRLFKFKRKNDETDYSIRLFPIGGYVSMAGESIEQDKNIPDDKQMYNKTWGQKFSTVLAGVLFNFLLAIILFFIVALSVGAPVNKNKIVDLEKNYPIEKTNIKVGDTIVKINGHRVRNQDMLMLQLARYNGKTINITVKNKKNVVKTYKVSPKKIKEHDQVSYRYGFALTNERKHGIIESIKYAFTKIIDLITQMFFIILYLITGKLKLSSLSGPVGIYSIVGESAKAGLISVIYLIAYLCVNVGFINLIPLPAFDGGRAFILILEKITGKIIPPKIENTIHSIGFVILMLLMVLITYNDILRLIK